MGKILDTTIRQINDNLEISTRYHPKDNKVLNHWHDYYEFEMVLEGEYIHTVNGEKRIAKRGSSWIMCPLDYHSLTATVDAIIINISFTGKDINEKIMSLLASSTGGFLCEYDEEGAMNVFEKAQLARVEMLEKYPLWECNVTSLIQSILVDTIRYSEKDTKSSAEAPSLLLQNVVSYLHKNYTEDLSLTVLAEKFSVSSGHLGLIFNKTFGMSLPNYVNRIRLRHACNLLEASMLSTKEIAFVSGFSSVEYFFYIFKKHMSITPGEYRSNAERQKNNL